MTSHAANAAAPPPDDLPALRNWLAARPDADQLAALPIREIVVRSNALAGLPDLLSRLDAPRRVLLLQDGQPYTRGGASLKPLVYDLLAGAGWAVATLTLPPSAEGTVLADLENVDIVRAAIGGQPTTVVALGSGTICDIAKHACFLAEGEDDTQTTLVLVPTAASVTAFTSSLAVLLVDGVKRTRPSRFPDAVLCDLETLADAPAAMTRAGLGDCVARFISYGDWYLAHHLGLVDRYSETPLDLMGEDLDAVYLEYAPLVAQGTSEGFDPGQPRPAPPSAEVVEATIQAAFGALDPSGRMAAECWRDYGRKLSLWAASGTRFDEVRARWDDEIGPRLRQLVRPSATISEILRRTGHPRTFEALAPSIPREQARFALGNAHLIRERFVIGDLLWWLGLAGAGLADELLAAGDAD
jgi:hypothetical protein